jgi:TfoX/Sxy family transcriptional regulator of competence genes
MSTTKEFAQYVLDQLPDGVTARKMMGEYILYINGRIFGGLYDNRLLVKITDSSSRILSSSDKESPYPGAKPMLLIEDVENGELLSSLVNSMYFELPEPKKKIK